MSAARIVNQAPIARPENTELPPTPLIERSRGILRLPRVKVPDRVKKVFKTIYHIVSSHLGLLIILFTYSFIGAAIFSAIEKPREDAEWQATAEAHNASIQQILNITFTAFNNNLTMQDENLTEVVERIMIEHAASFGGGKSEYSWDFWNSMLFCATVYTTIGYGHIAPVTSVGRIVVMIYALIGIPLCLVTLASLGRMLTKVIKFVLRFVRRLYHTGRCCPANRTVKVFEGRPNSSVSRQQTQVESSSNWRMSCMRCWRRVTCRKNKLHQDPEHYFGNELGVPTDDDIGSYVSLVDDDVDEFNVPPAVAIFVTVLYIAGGTVMYPFWESWGYMDSFYFIFVSISTIGFGDVLPEHPRYFLASSLYILFGLALVAMVINVIMVVVLDTIVKAKDTMQKAADHLDKAADKAKEAMMDVGQKMGIEMSSGSSCSSTDSVEKKGLDFDEPDHKEKKRKEKKSQKESEEEKNEKNEADV